MLESQKAKIYVELANRMSDFLKWADEASDGEHPLWNDTTADAMAKAAMAVVEGLDEINNYWRKEECA